LRKPPFRALAPALAATLTVLPGAAAQAAAPASWSVPATLGACPALGAARAVFPRDRPTHATGAGAVVWSGAPTCPQGGGTFVARIGAGDVPGRPAYALGPGGGRLALRPPLAVTAAPHGALVIAGSGGARGGTRC